MNGRNRKSKAKKNPGDTQSIWRLTGSAGSWSVGLMLGYRVVDLQLLSHDFLQNEGDKRSVRYESVPAHRGVIFDRNGKPLAASTPVVTIWGMPNELLKVPERWPELAKKLGCFSQLAEKRITAARGKEFIYLRRKMTPAKGGQVMALSIPGVYSRGEQKRYYPAGEVAAHLVGFTGIDENGQEGLELTYENWLSGEPGQRRLLKNRKGQVIREAELVKSAQPGKELMLSIDLRLQYHGLS